MDSERAINKVVVKKHPDFPLKHIVLSDISFDRVSSLKYYLDTTTLSERKPPVVAGNSSDVRKGRT